VSVDQKKSICENRRARFRYHLDETFEAGLALTGSEVKSLRAGKAHLNDAYGRLRGGELWLLKAHIAPYEQANRLNHEPERERKLLLHRREIDRIGSKIRERGYTLVPLRLYFKGGRAKVEVALGRGKKHHDKRQAVAERESKRQVERAMKRTRQGR
jgi:SsrA-binding protein